MGGSGIAEESRIGIREAVENTRARWVVVSDGLMRLETRTSTGAAHIRTISHSAQRLASPFFPIFLHTALNNAGPSHENGSSRQAPHPSYLDIVRPRYHVRAVSRAARRWWARESGQNTRLPPPNVILHVSLQSITNVSQPSETCLHPQTCAGVDLARRQNHSPEPPGGGCRQRLGASFRRTGALYSKAGGHQCPAQQRVCVKGRY